MTLTYLYWTSTALLSLLYLASATLYIAKADFVRKALLDLGYSASLLRPFLIGIKLLAPLAIVWHAPAALSDLAYAGIFYHLVLSALAHLGVRKPQGAIPAAAGLVLLLASFLTQNAARELPSPYAPTVSTGTAAAPAPLTEREIHP